MSSGVRARFDDACAALARIETEHGDAVTGRDGVLRHPYLGVWAMHCLRELLADGRDEGELARLGGRLGYLTGLVAVAALRAGVEAELEVVVPEDGLLLPTLGRIPAPAGLAMICVGDGRLALRTGEHELIERIDPTRVLIEQPEQPDQPGPIRLEDLDPFRNAFGHRISGRLDAGQVSIWSRTLAGALRLIGEHHRAYRPGLVTGLTSITPLATPPSGADASAASRHAFGAVASVLPPTETRLALLLIHEFQHVKLGALLDLVPLVDESDERLHHAPWRPDRRPLPALLQGAYAHIGVTDFWRVQSRVAPSPVEAGQARQQFARWGQQTAGVIDAMLASSSLTAEGRRFITGMGSTVGSWLDTGE